MATVPGDHRLLAAVADIDDRGLELAEGFLHERRYHDEQTGQSDPRTGRALLALDRVRGLTRAS